MPNKAVFLDRDGVIVEDSNYVYRLEQLKLISRSAEAIKLLNDNKFLTIVVSNQAGIAKGYFLERDAILFNDLMKKKLEEYGAKIDAIYFCPHHPEGKIDKYKINCDCRKPKSGMLKKAENELDIDLTQSFMIGDRNTDICAGKNVGCKSIIVMTGLGKYELKNNNIECDFIAQDLYNAAKYILDEVK